MIKTINLVMTFFFAAVILALATAAAPDADAQERRIKARISNAGFTMTALPLLAAKDWGVFTANGLDMEVILMQSALVPAALTQGLRDFFGAHTYGRIDEDPSKKFHTRWSGDRSESPA